MTSMKSFILMLHSAPWSNQSVATAVDFAKTAIKRGNKVKAIFLYQDAVLCASPNLDIPSDELNGQTALLELHDKLGVPLMLCVTAAEKRGINEGHVVPKFQIAGLAEFAEMTVSTDKVVQFK